MRRSGKSCFFGSYSHPRFAMGLRHSQEPSWCSGVNKNQKREGSLRLRVRTKRKHRATGGSSRPISACPDPKPASVTTGYNHNTISTIMTFIKCVSEGQALGGGDSGCKLCVRRRPLTASPRCSNPQLSPGVHSVYSGGETKKR